MILYSLSLLLSLISAPPSAIRQLSTSEMKSIRELEDGTTHFDAVGSLKKEGAKNKEFLEWALQSKQFSTKVAAAEILISFEPQNLEAQTVIAESAHEIAARLERGGLPFDKLETLMAIRDLGKASQISVDNLFKNFYPIDSDQASTEFIFTQLSAILRIRSADDLAVAIAKVSKIIDDSEFNPNRRLVATLLLAQLGDPGFAELKKRWEAASNLDRTAMTAALGSVSGHSAEILGLLKLGIESGLPLRSASLRVLERMAIKENLPDEFILPVKQIFKAKNESFNQQYSDYGNACAILGTFGELAADAIPDLLPIAESTNENILQTKLAAQMALLRMGSAAYPKILKIVGTDPEAPIFNMRLSSQIEGESLESVRRAASGEDHELAAAAIILLGRQKKLSATDAELILQILKLPPHSAMSPAAVDAAGHLPIGYAENLIQLYKSDEESERAYAIQSLGKMRGFAGSVSTDATSRIEQILVTAFNDPSESVQILSLAAFYLNGSDWSKATAALPLMTSKNHDIHRYALSIYLKSWWNSIDENLLTNSIPMEPLIAGVTDADPKIRADLYSEFTALDIRADKRAQFLKTELTRQLPEWTKAIAAHSDRAMETLKLIDFYIPDKIGPVLRKLDDDFVLKNSSEFADKNFKYYFDIVVLKQSLKSRLKDYAALTETDKRTIAEEIALNFAPSELPEIKIFYTQLLNEKSALLHSAKLRFFEKLATDWSTDSLAIGLLNTASPPPPAYREAFSKACRGVVQAQGLAMVFATLKAPEMQAEIWADLPDNLQLEEVDGKYLLQFFPRQAAEKESAHLSDALFLLSGQSKIKFSPALQNEIEERLHVLVAKKYAANDADFAAVAATVQKTTAEALLRIAGNPLINGRPTPEEAKLIEQIAH